MSIVRGRHPYDQNQLRLVRQNDVYKTYYIMGTMSALKIAPFSGTDHLYREFTSCRELSNSLVPHTIEATTIFIPDIEEKRECAMLFQYDPTWKSLDHIMNEREKGSGLPPPDVFHIMEQVLKFTEACIARTTPPLFHKNLTPDVIMFSAITQQITIIDIQMTTYHATLPFEFSHAPHYCPMYNKNQAFTHRDALTNELLWCPELLRDGFCLDEAYLSFCFGLLALKLAMNHTLYPTFEHVRTQTIHAEALAFNAASARPAFANQPIIKFLMRMITPSPFQRLSFKLIAQEHNRELLQQQQSARGPAFLEGLAPSRLNYLPPAAAPEPVKQLDSLTNRLMNPAAPLSLPLTQRLLNSAGNGPSRMPSGMPSQMPPQPPSPLLPPVPMSPPYTLQQRYPFPAPVAIAPPAPADAPAPPAPAAIAAVAAAAAGPIIADPPLPAVQSQAIPIYVTDGAARAARQQQPQQHTRRQPRPREPSPPLRGALPGSYPYRHPFPPPHRPAASAAASSPVRVSVLPRPAASLLPPQTSPIPLVAPLLPVPTIPLVAPLLPVPTSPLSPTNALPPPTPEPAASAAAEPEQQLHEHEPENHDGEA